ncbi:3'(2'),5'-bisphosphate nucleotidase 1-like protein [Drosera capensis]
MVPKGDQYVIALALLDEGNVVLGILACANLPLSHIGVENSESSNAEVGCLFYAVVGIGTYMQPLHGSSPVKVNVTAIKNTEEASSLNPLKLHIP